MSTSNDEWSRPSLNPKSEKEIIEAKAAVKSKPSSITSEMTDRMVMNKILDAQYNILEELHESNRHQKIIKGCLIFFTILTSLSLVVGFGITLATLLK